MDSEPKPKRTVPVTSCATCGSTWFREVALHRWPAVTTSSRWPDSEPDLLNQMQPRLLMCLCGMPRRPNLSGARGGPTQRAEQADFLETLQSSAGRRESPMAATKIPIGKLLGAVSKRRLAKAEERLTACEKTLLGWWRRCGWPLPAGERKPWRASRRGPEARGRDELVVALQQQVGLTFRMARRVLRAILDSCLEGLKRDRVLETPLGTFTVVPAPPLLPAVRFGKETVLFESPWRVRFRPSGDLQRAVRAGQESRQKNQKGGTKMAAPTKEALQCSWCGSTWLIEEEFRQYLETYSDSAVWGGDIRATGENAFRVRVCLCGNPVNVLARLGRKDVAGQVEFERSLGAARRFLDRVYSFSEWIDEAQKTLASEAVFRVLLDRLGTLELNIYWLRSGLRRKKGRPDDK